MRKADELKVMEAQVSQADGAAVATVQTAVDETVVSAYTSFFEALEELEDNKTLYGKASVEADIARRRVAEARDRAIAEWRSREAA